MAKEITGFVKLEIKGGAANPSPPIGPALGSKGVNIMEFCKQFNAKTKDKPGKVIPVLITVYSDNPVKELIDLSVYSDSSVYEVSPAKEITV